MNNKIVLVSQPYYFPWPGLFEQIKLSNTIVHYDDVQYSKGHFEDRVQVKTDSGSKWLTIPKKNRKLGLLINEVEIDNDKNWKQSHIDLLKQAYRKAPFRDEMLTVVESVFCNDYYILSELTIASTMAICEYFSLNVDRLFSKSSELAISGNSTQRVYDICKYLEASKYITGMGALNYFDFELFESGNIRVEFIKYNKNPYSQLHGDFNPYVTCLDLIANKGKNGLDLLNSTSHYWKDFIKSEEANNYKNR